MTIKHYKVFKQWMCYITSNACDYDHIGHTSVDGNWKPPCSKCIRHLKIPQMKSNCGKRCGCNDDKYCINCTDWIPKA